ncbi:hypothetical protein F0344_19015 [Streptomyces finlayi]|uniref:Uncharacterized protein n=1 Tax=Streptomyces finlayi TaxID=67296 RepID=A0A7G7BM73_9ACTN|nr:hypothetical protein [Streptomyces finlayi]QNE76438.1 hypothetical protein F0344_19015 [Streptomyces finlayi]
MTPDNDSAPDAPEGCGAPAHTEDRLALIDHALALPFPAGDGNTGVRDSGPGHHFLILQATQDFWDDRSAEVVEPAEQEIEDEFSRLATELTERWAEPETVELWPYLEGGEDGCEQGGEGGGAAPEPLSRLCNLAGSMQVWRVPGSGRWVGLAVGQADPEFPIWLLAAVGADSALPAG